MDSNTSVDTPAALAAELDEIARRRGRPQRPMQPDAAAQSYDDRMNHLKQRMKGLGLTALCLSGGGIRSAAFCLGVLQALASKNLLGKFDYLSTVSGGGYIGGWLQMRIRTSGGVAQMQADIAAPSATALHGLRRFSNYLTPQTGPFSTDTWTAVVLYLRNLMLNWMVFTPLFLLLALAAVFYRTLIYALYPSPAATVLLMAIAAAVLVQAVRAGCSDLPSHAIDGKYTGPRAIAWRIVTPVAVWSLVLPITVEHAFAYRSIVIHQGRSGLPDWLYGNPALSYWLLGHLWIFAVIHLTVMLLGYAMAWQSAKQNDPGRRLYKRNLPSWLAASIVTALLTWFVLDSIHPTGALYVAALQLITTKEAVELFHVETLLATFGPLLFAGLHLLQTALYVGLRREAEHADLDREWLARLSAQVLLFAVGWTLFAFCCVVLAPLFLVTTTQLKAVWNPGSMTATAAGTTVIGALTAWLGKKAAAQIEAVATKAAKQISFLLTVGAAAFGVLLFALSGSLLQHFLGNVQIVIQDMFMPGTSPIWLPVTLQLVLAAILSGLLMFSRRLNVNRFSMHAIYRNRLTRGFLGSARTDRLPDPYTGFDPADNPSLRHFIAPGAAPYGLFPVINIALNVTSGDNTELAERKAESFTATPLHCGAAALRRRGQAGDENAQGAFVPTAEYAGMETRADTTHRDHGPKLGTMLTVSGAAVSPNSGYHSSRVTAFLMTLFNVRLGVWLPNPAQANPDDMRLAKPANSLHAIVSELIGRSTDTSQAVYLSDGGHFENLGLYEMLRRRCRFIVVVDAAQDRGCTFFDLGNAIRKASIDLGVVMTMDNMRIQSRAARAAKDAPAPLGMAVGTIRYDDGGTGKILYLKPSFLPHIPADIRAYGLANKDFPHEDTEDQWFSESQFESYRALGMWQMRNTMDSMVTPDIGNLIAAAEAACGT